jgi:hypothetical protein
VDEAASRRAATCVQPEQASKVKSRGPTGLNNWEGRWSPWEQPTDDREVARRGKGRGTPTQHTEQHGRSSPVRGRASRFTFRVELSWKSEGLIVPLTLGGECNHRGGKEPGRTAGEAVQTVRHALYAGHAQVVDADLSQYFDSIPHKVLMQVLASRLSDRKLLRLLKRWLKTPVAERSTRGIPQGGVISSLLANLYLNR